MENIAFTYTFGLLFNKLGRIRRVEKSLKEMWKISETHGFENPGVECNKSANLVQLSQPTGPLVWRTTQLSNIFPICRWVPCTIILSIMWPQMSFIWHVLVYRVRAVLTPASKIRLLPQPSAQFWCYSIKRFLLTLARQQRCFFAINNKQDATGRSGRSLCQRDLCREDQQKDGWLQ